MWYIWFVDIGDGAYEVASALVRLEIGTSGCSAKRGAALPLSVRCRPAASAFKKDQGTLWKTFPEIFGLGFCLRENITDMAPNKGRNRASEFEELVDVAPQGKYFFPLNA